MSKCFINEERCQRNEAGVRLGWLRKKVDGLFGHRGDESFMTVADHCMHAWQRGDLLRRALSVTASDQDACRWIFPMDSAQKGASSAIRLRGHTTSVGHDYISPGGAGSRAQAAVAQLGAYDFAVCPAGPASEVLNVIFCHVASLINSMKDTRSKDGEFR